MDGQGGGFYRQRTVFPNKHSTFWGLTQHLATLPHMALLELGPCYLLGVTGLTFLENH